MPNSRPCAPPAGTRDAVLLGTGCRRAEAASLQLSDWDPPASRLTVVGKGNKQRHLYLAENTRAALTAWIQIRGTAPGHLFNAVNRHGRIDLSKGLTGQAISARIPPCSPHDFRRSHVSAAIDAGTDLLAVAQNADHDRPLRPPRRGRPAQGRRRACSLCPQPPVVFHNLSSCLFPDHMTPWGHARRSLRGKAC